MASYPAIGIIFIALHTAGGVDLVCQPVIGIVDKMRLVAIGVDPGGHVIVRVIKVTGLKVQIVRVLRLDDATAGIVVLVSGYQSCGIRHFEGQTTAVVFKAGGQFQAVSARVIDHYLFNPALCIVGGGGHHTCRTGCFERLPLGIIFKRRLEFQSIGIDGARKHTINLIVFEDSAHAIAIHTAAQEPGSIILVQCAVTEFVTHQA